jgi:hypothetical protein
MGPHSRLENYLHCHEAHLHKEYDGVNDISIVVARFAVNMGDLSLLQPLH